MFEDLPLIKHPKFFKKLAIFEKFIVKELEKYKGSIFYESVLYSLKGGKRIRPMILLFCSEIINYPKEEPFSAALAVELIHSVSLVHDDIIDNERYRRGKISYHVKYGNEQAILLADFVLSIILELVSRYKTREISLIISECVKKMSEGQILEIKIKDKKTIEWNEYLKIIENKTASLFESSAKIGGILTTNNEIYIENLTSFGRNLGLMYQIYDDLKDWNKKEYVQKLNKKDKLNFLKEKVKFYFNLSSKSLENLPNNKVKDLLKEFIQVAVKVI